MKYQILLFYKYTEIGDPEAEKSRQEELCEKLKLKCRMIVAKEGINGTLEGSVKNTEKYISEISKDDRFKDIHWKKSEGNGIAFPKISVKVRSEIVALGLQKDINPNQTSGKYITAEELHALYKAGEEFYIVDMRNDYEQKVGHFENAILMPMKNFRELPETLKNIEHLKNKKIITTCTGGIRCEKASGFLVDNGFTNVYQLYGGMQTYMEQFPNKHFLGKLYVFDSRLVWGINTDDPEHKIIGQCEICGKPSDQYADCAYLHCKDKRHFITCDDCKEENGLAFCTADCKEKAEATKSFYVKDPSILEGLPNFGV
jgi:UPF0176 protein